METVTEKLSNGNEITYKIYNGTAYHVDTPIEVINALETARIARQFGRRLRLRLFLGDPETGRDWGEEYDVIGYIGRSGGHIKIPLLLPNATSVYGGASRSSHLADCGRANQAHRLSAPTLPTPQVRTGRLPAKIGAVNMAAEGYT
jgi:hypothetical protein